MFLSSIFCVVLLALELGDATPQGNRFKESNGQNENDGLNVGRHIGEQTNSYNIHNNLNEIISQENQKNVLLQNENVEKKYMNNNPEALRDVNKQPNIISEKKQYNKIIADDLPRPSYIASLPQVNRIQSFRSKDGGIKRANIPTMGDILSEVSNQNNNFSPIELNPPIIQENNFSNQINDHNRPNSQVPNILNNKKEEEDVTQLDVPEATPEYIKSLLNEYKHSEKVKVKSKISNFQLNSQNFDEASFQNPSAEVLYETGQAKPYEISSEQLQKPQHGKKPTHNILHDRMRLKNLYLSSKPTKHYMIVYPDGRVEQVDQLDKIQKMHPNYVMLNAKDLLQHGKPHQEVSTGSHNSVVKSKLSIRKTDTMKPELSSVKDTKDDKIETLPRTVDKQTLPVPIEPFSVATEQSIIPMQKARPTNNIEHPIEDKVLTNISPENNMQNKLQDNVINDNQEGKKVNNNENVNLGLIGTTANNSSIQVDPAIITETQILEDTETNVKSPESLSSENTEILNQNITNSVATSKGIDSPNLAKEQEDNDSTSGSNLINTKLGGDVSGKNSIPIPKQASDEDNDTTKNIPIPTDVNSIQESNYSPNNIETSNTSDPSLSPDSLLHKADSNLITQSSNGNVTTFKDNDENSFYTETIIDNNNNDGNAPNPESNNVSSKDNTQIDTNPLPSSNSLSNNTLDFQEKEENNVDEIPIHNVSNITNSKVDGVKKDSNNNDDMEISFINAQDNPYDLSSKQEGSNLDKTSSAYDKPDSRKYTDDGTDNSDVLLIDNPAVSDNRDSNTTSDASNVITQSDVVTSNEEDTIVTNAAENELYYLNSPQKELSEDNVDNEENENDEEDKILEETIPEPTNMNDNLVTESPSSDINVNESPFLFNASDSFWNKLMSSNEHNTFYFLFPRPQAKTKETKKTIYPNGTMIIEEIETVENDDGATSTSKTVVTCGNSTSCEKTL